MNRGPVLILDAEAIASLDVARSLGRRGVASVALGDPRSLLRYSRFVGRRNLTTLGPDLDPDAAVAAIGEVARSLRVSMILPLGAGSTWLLATRGPAVREMAPEAAFLVPPSDKLAVTLDKATLYRRAAQAGVAVPRTWLPANASEADALAGLWSGPVVVKPRITSGARGMVVAARPEDLPEAYRLVASRFSSPLVQERIPVGAKIQVGVLHRSTTGPLAVSCLEVLRHYPPAGGPSTCVVTRTDPEAVAAALKLLGALEWDGLAHVEFLRDRRDGRLVLIDFNPRVWGTLGASLAGGVDFPVLLYDLLVGEGLGHGNGPGHGNGLGPSDGASLTGPQIEGRLWRRLFFSDMVLYLASIRRRGIWKGPSFWRLIGFQEATWDRADPWPLLAYVGRTLVGGWLSREAWAYYGGSWGFEDRGRRGRSASRTLEELMEREVAALAGPPLPGPVGPGGEKAC